MSANVKIGDKTYTGVDSMSATNADNPTEQVTFNLGDTKVTGVTNTVSGDNLTTKITNSDGTEINSAPVKLPTGGGGGGSKGHRVSIFIYLEGPMAENYKNIAYYDDNDKLCFSNNLTEFPLEPETRSTYVIDKCVSFECDNPENSVNLGNGGCVILIDDQDGSHTNIATLSCAWGGKELNFRPNKIIPLTDLNSFHMVRGQQS